MSAKIWWEWTRQRYRNLHIVNVIINDFCWCRCREKSCYHPVPKRPGAPRRRGSWRKIAAHSKNWTFCVFRDLFLWILHGVCSVFWDIDWILIIYKLFNIFINYKPTNFKFIQNFLGNWTCGSIDLRSFTHHLFAVSVGSIIGSI